MLLLLNYDINNKETKEKTQIELFKFLNIFLNLRIEVLKPVLQP